MSLLERENECLLHLAYFDCCSISTLIISILFAMHSVDDIATTPVNTDIRIPVLDNDIDPPTLESVTQPTNGMAGIRPDNTVIYKPDPDFIGEDSFTYTICDSANQCDEATVFVVVELPPNQQPIAEDDFVKISEGMNQSPQIPVLANDNDPDGDVLIVTEVFEPENGLVVTWRWSPYYYCSHYCGVGFELARWERRWH